MRKFKLLVEKSITFDPWAKKRGVEGYCNEIKAEADEVIEAVRKRDYANLQEELGDVLLDWTHAVMLAEKQGLFTMEQVVDGAAEKLERRKPFLKEDRKVTFEEAKQLWDKAKAAEHGNKRR